MYMHAYKRHGHLYIHKHTHEYAHAQMLTRRGRGTRNGGGVGDDARRVFGNRKTVASGTRSRPPRWEVSCILQIFAHLNL